MRSCHKNCWRSCDHLSLNALECRPTTKLPEVQDAGALTGRPQPRPGVAAPDPAHREDVGWAGGHPVQGQLRRSPAPPGCRLRGRWMVREAGASPGGPQPRPGAAAPDPARREAVAVPGVILSSDSSGDHRRRQDAASGATGWSGMPGYRPGGHRPDLVPLRPAGRCRWLPTAPEPPGEAIGEAAGRDSAHLKAQVIQDTANRQDCRTTPGSRHQVPGRTPEGAAMSEPCRGAATHARRSRSGPPVNAGGFRRLQSRPGRPPGAPLTAIRPTGEAVAVPGPIFCREK